MTPLRSTALVVGLALLVATAHATIVSTGGYGSAHSAVTLAIVAGVAVASLAIGTAWGERRGLALWLIAAITAGELFGLLSTAERLIAGREAQQVPLRAQATAHEGAVRRVADAAAALSNAPASSPRLAAALAEKAAADAATNDKSAERGCRENCRALLQARVDAAEREVASARNDLAAIAGRRSRELDAARAGLAAMTPPASATPLADRIGISAWLLDLIAAALGSLAANGLGCGLVAFAGHAPRKNAIAPDVVAPAPLEVVTPVVHAPAVSDHMRRFAFDRLWPAEQPDAGADIPAIRSAYKRWCAATGNPSLSGEALGQAMADLFEHVGISIEDRDGHLMAMGVALRGEKPALPTSGSLGRISRRVTA